MATQYKDWLGHNRIDITPEVNRAVDEANQRAQFRHDMSNIGSNFQGNLGGAARDAVATTAVMGVTAGAVGVAAAKNRRFRYILQAVLHFPFAMATSYTILLLIGVGITSAIGTENFTGDDFMVMLGVSFVLGIPVGIAWSVVYIRMRTLPKLRRLDAM